MITEKYSLRWYHFLASWVLCLTTGIVLQSIFMMGLGSGPDSLALALLTALIALMISSPFIVVFCLIIHFNVLKKERTRKQIHRLVFMWHSIGSVLVFLGLAVFANSEMKNGADEILLIMLGYFVIDSIYFAVFINRNTRKVVASELFNEELLDL